MAEFPQIPFERFRRFHQFYKQCRVVTDDVALTAARLKLVAAAQSTLARTLGLMGMTAPERM